MWGEVTPAERLRAVTRRHTDEERLAVEAADALAGFAHEPASLVASAPTEPLSPRQKHLTSSR